MASSANDPDTRERVLGRGRTRASREQASTIRLSRLAQRDLDDLIAPAP